jgi:hypothetical protein
MGKLFFHHLTDLYDDENEAGSASHIVALGSLSEEATVNQLVMQAYAALFTCVPICGLQGANINTMGRSSFHTCSYGLM